jgi:hypothetical protein
MISYKFKVTVDYSYCSSSATSSIYHFRSCSDFLRPSELNNGFGFSVLNSFSKQRTEGKAYLAT